MNNKFLDKTWIEINKSSLIKNIAQFKKIISPKVKFCAVVKSNAYGHGLSEVAKICQENGADWLGVDSIDEALILKKAGVAKLPILILGYVPLARLFEAVTNQFRLTVYNKETILALVEIPNSKFQIPNKSQIQNFKIQNKSKIKNLKSEIINVHIKVETGTSRQGVLEKDILDFVRLIKKYPQINIEGLSTHFANIEDTTDHSYAMMQLERFKRIVALLEKNGISIPIKHTACSAATILFPQTHFDMVRVGISMYGLWSSRETRVSANSLRRINLQPALIWKTKIAQIKELETGTPISYGLTEKLSRDSKLAILPVGYWDGYDRGLSSIGNVLVGGKRCKVLGRVCMNMIIVDVTDVSDVKIEDEAVLLGKQGNEEISADEIAQKIGTINYEVVTRINPLIKRVSI
ncbi:MAG: alanine racemase [Patescibacteria group bacterium]